MDLDPSRLVVASEWHPHVYDVWVCGSAARADSDALSDLDITVVVTDEASTGLSGDPIVSTVETHPLDVSVYSLSGFKSLVRPPSLFAWHLALEGELVFGPGAASALLAALEPFSDHAEDLRVLHRLALESAGSLGSGSPSLVFELGVLATVLRNAALIVSHFDGAPDFSRNAPIRLLHHSEVPLPFPAHLYRLMSRARKAGEGVGAPPTVTGEEAEEMANRVVEWVVACLNYVERV